MNVWSHRRHIATQFLPQLLKMYVPRCCEADTSAHALSNVIRKRQSSNPGTKNIMDLNGCCEGCWIVKEFNFSNEILQLDCRNNTAMSFRSEKLDS